MRITAFALAAALAGCSAGSPPSQPPYVQAGTALRDLAGTGAGKIRHVVYIVQEDRSFDDLFQGYPGADTVPRGKDSRGRTIELAPVSLKDQYVVDHSAAAMFAACNGTGKLPGTSCRNDGFDKEPSYGGPPSVKHPQYAYVPHDESKPYFEMAHEWVVADHMFASQLDGDFVAHQYIIAAQAARAVDLPTGTWGCGGSEDDISTLTDERTIGRSEPACFDYQTLGGELEAANLSWRFYTSDRKGRGSGAGAGWSSYASIRGFYGSRGWERHIVAPQKRFLTDVARGTLANVTWITPICANSDHPNCGGGYGPSWVAAIVNAVGKSRFWDSTAIFVQWDDWGGLYDHVPPPYENFDSVGFRVPLLVISPYARHDHVSRVEYETASVLRFAEDLFGLAQLAAADTRANSPAADCFDFSQGPRAFVPIEAPKGAGFFKRQRG